MNIPAVLANGEVIDKSYMPDVIAYNDPILTYLGRWQDTGNGMWSGWAGGSQIAFKVSGVTQFHVVMDIINADTADTAALVYNIDNNSDSGGLTFYSYSAVGESYNGRQLGTITLPDTNEHTIILHTVGYNAGVFAGTSKMTIREILLPPSGAITSWAQGSKIVQCVGDSWMGGTEDWPRLMDRTKWELYPIGAGGLKASDMDAQYDYKSNGVNADDDPTMDGVIISFGVNDFNASVTVGNFQTSLLSVVDKVRAKQADAPIFLIQAPKNLGTGKDFGQYGTAMENIVGLRGNISYISTRSLEATLTWTDDTYHLDAEGKTLLANYISAELVSAEI